MCIRDRYKRLALLGAKLVDKGGTLVLASCSSRVSPALFYSEIESALSEHKQSYEILDTYGHDIDHPVLEGFPEGEYLKCVFVRMKGDLTGF